MNPHTSDPHDPVKDLDDATRREALLTAYALGETDANETAQAEAILSEDADAVRAVGEVRALAGLLGDGLAAEEVASLPATARAAVLSAAAPQAVTPEAVTPEAAVGERGGSVRSFWPLVAMAASVVVGVGLAGWSEKARPTTSLEFAGGQTASVDDLDRLRLRESVSESGSSPTWPGGAVAQGDAATWGADACAPGELTRVTAPPAKPTGTLYALDGNVGGRGGELGGDRAVPRVGRVEGRRGRPFFWGSAGGEAEDFDVEIAQASEIGVPLSKSGLTHSGIPSIDEVMEDARVTFLLTTRDEPVAVVPDLRLKLERLERLAVDLPAERTADVDVAVATLKGWIADAEELAELRERGRRFAERNGLRYGIPGTEDYAHPGESTFRDPRDEPLSTFSIDVDTASYANVRRFLNNGQMPPPAAVRIEELVNYFTYTDAAPEGEHPIAATVETATCPWNTASRLVRVGVKAREVQGDAPPANLVFLVDVSGSMQPADKLPLLQNGLKMLTDTMREQDRIAIVTYASDSGVRLESTTGAEKDTIKATIDGLSAGGSTNGGSGIQMAYDIAAKHFAPGGTNRVILATDGDFNVGVTDQTELRSMIEEKAKSGVFLTVLGVGTGNLKDSTMEQIADRGNGSYHYLDGLREARRVLVEDVMGTVVTVAKDVKIQVEFNPLTVGAYRLVGYENRMLAAADFNDDTKDAGEMGAGHTVTALYEVVPAGASPQPGVDPLRYQKPAAEATDAARSGEMLTLKVRYKQPDASESMRFELTSKDTGTKYDDASENLRFASAVASFGMLLRGSPAAEGTSFSAVLEVAQGAIGKTDPGSRRAEFLDLVLKAKALSGR